MTQTPSYQELQARIDYLENRVRKLSEEKANLYLILHMVELLNPIAGVESLLESLMSALCSSLGGTNVEIYYLDEGDIHYANLSGERRIIDNIDDKLVAEVFRHHIFIEQPTDMSHTMLVNNAKPVACSWVMPLLVGSELLGVIKMSNLLGSAQMRNYLSPFFSHMALLLSNEIKTRIAQTANKAKSNFLATMSHEIRTPLNGILGMAQLQTLPDCAPDKHLECARTILSSGQTLLTLLNDVLDLSKIEANKLELVYSAANPRQIINHVVSLFAESAHQKHLQLSATWTGPSEQCYQMDQNRVRQMLSNLVNNAIKFTDQGLIVIEAREVKRDGQQAELEFSVSDQGIGIAVDQQRLLFKAFTQVDGGSTRRYAGTGLGLSIVLRFTELMHGKTGVDSKPGEGARFWFRIPCNIAACLPINGIFESKTLAQIEPDLATHISDAAQPPLPQTLVSKPNDAASITARLDLRYEDRTVMFDNLEIGRALDELDRLLVKNMFGAIAQFKVLENLLKGSELSAHFSAIGQLINEMKFEQAHSQLHALLANLRREVKTEHHE
jgi:signal transduction histidine kinase